VSIPCKQGQHQTAYWIGAKIRDERGATFLGESGLMRRVIQHKSKGCWTLALAPVCSRSRERPMSAKRPKVKKLGTGTYRVTFTKGQSYDVVIPSVWIEILLYERELEDMAIECAKEHLPTL